MVCVSVEYNLFSFLEIYHSCQYGSDHSQTYIYNPKTDTADFDKEEKRTQP